MFNKLHTLTTKAQSGSSLIPFGNQFTDLSNGQAKEEIIREFLFGLITEGIRNQKGRYAYEDHELTWELRTGDMNVTLAESFKNEFTKKLRENNIGASVSVKNNSNKLDVWVIFKQSAPLETDLQVNRIFRQLEKQYSKVDMSLYMASEDELNGNNFISF